MSDQGLHASVALMRERGLGPEAIRVFEHYYEQLQAGALGTIPEESIEPLGEVQTLREVQVSDEEAREALSRTAVIKLNGGLGTGMGMTGAKSALEVKDGLTFLDIIALQVLALRERWGVELPLVLMNSFRTSEESLKILAKYPDLPVDGLPLDFIQNAEPKLRPDDLMPVQWPDDPELEWCPPGHGDIYVSLVTSGVLDSLLEKGIRYAFLSNSDNLGATCDPDVAAWMVEHGLPYVAEVCKRTKSDRKGGHLAVRKSDGRIVLRDTAMVAEGEERYFRDIKRHNTFNANNVWINLEVLRERMTAKQGVLGLPIIVNHKNVDPADPGSPEVIQMESAMGTAIEVFEGSEAILVPRTRFRPVKTTNDLLVIRSDFFALDEGYHVVATVDAPEPYVDLDSAYRFVSGFEQRFPKGVPSMRDCTSLRVIGDPVFGRNVRCVGEVLIDGYRRVLDDAVLGELPTPQPAPVTTPGDVRTVDEHLKAILSTLQPSPTEWTPLTEALGLVVARDVRAKVNLPHFDNSSMDGYAVRAESLASAGESPVRLRIVGEVAAGANPTFSVGVGEAARIMTGAPIPEGADAVIAVESQRARWSAAWRSRRVASSVRRARTCRRARSSSRRARSSAPAPSRCSRPAVMPRSRSTAGRTSSCCRPVPSSSSPEDPCSPVRSTTPTRRCCGLPPSAPGRRPRSGRRSATPTRSCSPCSTRWSPRPTSSSRAAESRWAPTTSSRAPCAARASTSSRSRCSRASRRATGC
jgi:UTP--glucose-1-phosphate uridylyltransferase